MTKRQKENLAKILINLGSIVFAGVVLGFFISDNKITTAGFILGTFSTTLSFAGAIFLDK